MNEIILAPHKEESLLRFHPWVFSGAIRKIVLDKNYPFDEIAEGEIVLVRSSEGKVLGVGHWQIGSIAVRILEFGVSELPEHFWEDRIRAAFEVRCKLNLVRPQSSLTSHPSPLTTQSFPLKGDEKGSINDTFRLIHGEGDFLPGLIVDIYDDTAVIQAHSVGMHKSRMQVADAVLKVVPFVKNVYYKSEGTLPFKAPIPEEEKRDQYLYGEPTSCVGTENGLRFGIDWLRGQKTGFFVDQRENRALLERYSEGKDVLNMFCYTGGFSVYALRGGAKRVDSVDCSEKAIELVRENVARNFPDCANHNAVVDDAFHFLENNKNQYDLIILDPPAFAKHRGAIKNALQGYKRLNAKAFQQIRPGGILFTFSCSQAIDKEMFRLAVFSAAAMSGRKVRILHQLHQPQDHPINIYHPEGEYLKGLVLQVE